MPAAAAPPACRTTTRSDAVSAEPAYARATSSGGAPAARSDSLATRASSVAAATLAQSPGIVGARVSSALVHHHQPITSASAPASTLPHVFIATPPSSVAAVPP